MEAKHTKLPWHIGERSGNAGFRIYAGEQPIAEIRYIRGESCSKKGIEEEKANAEFIVKAVNCHDDLLAASELAVAEIEAELACQPDLGLEQALERLGAAIKKSKG